MFIKNINDNSVTNIQSYEFTSYPDILRLYLSKDSDIDFINNLSGFEIYLDAETRVYNCFEYKYLYNKTDNYIEFINNNTIYYTYAIYNDNNYITSVITVLDDKYENGILVNSGYDYSARNYASDMIITDENGCYNYKVIKGKITTTSDSEKAEQLAVIKNNTLKSIYRFKIQELTNTCQNIIINGISYNGKHYSYNYSDQNNISNLVQMAKTTGMDVPYHADGESCELYSPTDIYTIYIAQEINVTQNTTYLNQLKAYIDTLDDIDVIKNIVYGQELTGEYLQNFNNIMEHSQKIIEVLNAETAKISQ